MTNNVETLTEVPAGAIVKPQKDAIKCGVFGGMLGAFGTDLYHTLKAYGLGAKIAHKCAIDYMSELGAAIKSDAQLRATVSMVKDGKSSFKAPALKFNKDRAMHSVSTIARVVYTVDELHKKGAVSLEKRIAWSAFHFMENEREYLAKSTKWTATQKWEGETEEQAAEYNAAVEASQD